jgi:hypothetical protein
MEALDRPFGQKNKTNFFVGLSCQTRQTPAKFVKMALLNRFPGQAVFLAELEITGAKPDGG